MARIRTIKPEFWDSPDTARASFAARLLYIAMWNWADDYGVGTAGTKELLGFAFPNDEAVTVKEFPSLLKEVADTFGADFYTVRGRPYYSIPSWDQHQKTERRANRRNPPPDDPERAPDLRFQGNLGTSSHSQGNTLQSEGGSPAGTGEQGNRGTGEQGTYAADAAARNGGGELVVASTTALAAAAPTSQTLIGEWIDHCTQPPPSRVKGQIAKEVKTMLDEGIPYDRVRAGLAEWNSRGLHPSTLPSVVHEVANKAPRRPNTRQQETDDLFDAAMQRALERDGSNL